MQIILPKLHPAQIEIQTHPARFKVCACGRRFGKGTLGIGEAVLRASTGQACWWICPSFASAAFQSGWRMLEFYSTKLPGASLHSLRRTLDLPGGGFVQFKTSEEIDSLRGESINFAVIDESAHIQSLQNLWELCLRSCLLDRKGHAWFISTPHGHNYFHDLFQRGKNGDAAWASFQFPSTSNPYLDATELADIAKDMPTLVKRQEIDAEFVQLAGAMFKRDDVRILETEPAGVHWVRSWDLAFTTKTTSDYTAGIKVGMMEDGCIVVTNIVRGRWEWPQAVRIIAATAQADGPTVPQGIEVVGAQTGMIQTLMADPLLANLTFQPISVHQDKVSRALPVISRCEQKKLAIVRGDWNKEFLDELSSFPESKHDDMVDALSASLVMLSSEGTGAWSADTLRQGVFIGASQAPIVTLRHFEPRFRFQQPADTSESFEKMMKERGLW
jgi:predicted phage terminase large subunit-like protein